MIKAVLFDLDGTLLPMDQEAFVKEYFSRLGAYLTKHGFDGGALCKAVWAATTAMIENDSSKSNEARFWQAFYTAAGVDASIRPLIDRFYDNDFHSVSASFGANPAAAQAVRLVKDAGAMVVLATNPIFPAAATAFRAMSAGLCADDFSLITTYENSTRCKPNPDYYREILRKIGVRAEECIMVGNDVKEDMTAGTLGMKTFLLTDCLINTENADISPYPQGGFDELIAYLTEEL